MATSTPAQKAAYAAQKHEDATGHRVRANGPVKVVCKACTWTWPSEGQ